MKDLHVSHRNVVQVHSIMVGIVWMCFECDSSKWREKSKQKTQNQECLLTATTILGRFKASLAFIIQVDDRCFFSYSRTVSPSKCVAHLMRFDLAITMILALPQLVVIAPLSHIAIMHGAIYDAFRSKISTYSSSACVRIHVSDQYSTTGRSIVW